MSRAIYSLRLPMSMKRAAERLAKEDGVSLNQWIAAAVAELSRLLLSSFPNAQEIGKDLALVKFLKKAPKRPPDKGDEIG